DIGGRQDAPADLARFSHRFSPSRRRRTLADSNCPVHDGKLRLFGMMELAYCERKRLAIQPLPPSGRLTWVQPSCWPITASCEPALATLSAALLEPGPERTLTSLTTVARGPLGGTASAT